MKCKRSGTTLPLKKGNGIQLLQTFAHLLDDELKEKIRRYVRKLKESNSLLPRIVDLQSMVNDENTVMIMNEGNLSSEKYERLLHWMEVRACK